jgi:kumamolisin
MSKMCSIYGSFRAPVPGVKTLRDADPKSRIKVSIYARRNPKPHKAMTSVSVLSQELPSKRHYLSNAEFDAIYGADPGDLEQIKSWAEKSDLKVLDSSVSKRRVRVEGTIEAINRAFGVALKDYEHPRRGAYRGREGYIHVPSDLYGIVQAVFGLDTRRVGRARRRRSRFVGIAWKAAAGSPSGKTTPTNPFPGSFFPPDVANLYSYPPKLDGNGQNLAIFAFNGAPDGDPHGGYDPKALKTYFENVLGGTTPSIKDVVVQGSGNNPGPDTKVSSDHGDSTGEVMLDMCVVGSVAPGANIFMYFTEFTTQGWIDALHEAMTDHNQISIISISYGNPEDDPEGAWTAMGVKLVDQAFEAASAKGITICCASGDDGSSDQVSDGAHVDFPASSPFVLGIGGTKLVASKNKIESETVWDEIRIGEGAGGGGISAVFSKPAYQNSVDVPASANTPHSIGRGVPDVSAIADPESGVVVMHIDGQHLESIGGTSAAAPLWAALIARLNQGLGARCGFLNPILYTKGSKNVLRDITVGNNGAYAAQKGWDACTGLGSPNGIKLLGTLNRR